MRCSILGAIIGVILTVGRTDADATTEMPLPVLFFSAQDLDFPIHKSRNVNLTLSSAPSECINITFTFDKALFNDVEPIEEVCPDYPDEFEWIVTINSNDNGKTLFRATASSEDVVIDENAYIRMSIMTNPGINTGGDVLGWIYTIAWDISFLPQIYRNWKRKSVVGLAFDFLVFNFIGFFSYLMYNIGNLWIPEIEKEFHDRHPTSVMHVRLNDVIFPLYALICTALQIIQCFIYHRGPEQRVSMACRIISSILVLAEVIVLIVVAASDSFNWLDLLLFFSYVKICITCVKYIPQLYMNYKVKSTEGWSIWQVILDCTGGTLSLVQMFMIAANYDDIASVLTDPAKLGLGLLSIFFNIFFFMQHYCIYRGAKISEDSTPMKSLDGEEKSSRKSSVSSRKSSVTSRKSSVKSRKSSVSSKNSSELQGVVNPDPEAHL